MSYRRRGYVEVLDNLLTAIVGGVAAERHPYPPPSGDAQPYRNALVHPPAARVVSVHGARNGKPCRFTGDDYRLSGDGTELEWIQGGRVPDEGTVFLVNYIPEGANAVVDDVQVGSVVRTLSESVALEIARLYAELEAVQDAGYVDSAAGSELERVVALLGIKRVPGGRPGTELTFTRSGGSRGAITIPTGTRAITADGDVAYETTETVTMLDGQGRIRARARDVEPGDPLAAGALTTLPVPITGIAAVTNEKPTKEADAPESDAELRERAKRFLHGSERATLGALNEAVVSQGVRADIEDAMTADDLGPGTVRISLHGEDISPEQEQRVRTAVGDVRPAGVVIDWATDVAPRLVDLELRLTTVSGLVTQQLRGIQESVAESIAGYFARLEVRAAASVAKIVNLAMSVDGVEDARLVAATLDDDSDVLDAENGVIAIDGLPAVLGELSIADPALATEVELVVGVAVGAVAEPDATRRALARSLDALVAWLNQQSEAAAGEEGRRLDFGLLLYALELPDSAAGSPASPPPNLPSIADLAGVDSVSLAITDGGGRSSVLAAGGDSYLVAVGERLSVQAVELTETTA